MKGNFKDWFASLPALPGLLAGGVRRANGKCAAFGDEKRLPTEKVEALLANFAGLHAPLGPELSPAWTTWVFEFGRLRYVPRRDGWLLLPVVAPETEAEKSLDRLSREFLAGLD